MSNRLLRSILKVLSLLSFNVHTHIAASFLLLQRFDELPARTVPRISVKSSAMCVSDDQMCVLVSDSMCVSEAA